MRNIEKIKLFGWRIQLNARRLKKKIISESNPDPDVVTEAEFDSILSDFSEENVFVHAGLSDIKKAFGENPYEFLIDKLTANFDCVMAPGFTPSFRDSGIYHTEFSRPEYGMFSKLFHEDAEYRTDDAIHSILVKGDYRFDECNHHDSFGDSSCWAKFDDDNILYLNIGTKEFVSTHLHYIETKFDLPYVYTPEHDGYIYTDRCDYNEISQSNYGCTNQLCTPNWVKLRKFLKSENVIEDRSFKGLNIYSFHAQDMSTALGERLSEDPYYIVT